MGIKPHELELNKILWDELTLSVSECFNTRYANTKISDKAKKDLIKGGISDAVVYWSQQATKEAETIGRNPKKEIAEKRLNKLRQRSDSSERIIKAVADYIAMEFEHYMNLGHTDAFVYLISEFTIITAPLLKTINPSNCYSFLYRGDLNHFYNQCIDFRVIHPKTSIDSFKTAFEGCDYKGEEPLKWITKQKNHIVYLFDLLLEKKLIHNHIEKDDSYIKINHNVSIGALMGETNIQVGKIRASWKQYTSKPSRADYIEKLVDSLIKQ